MQLPNLVPIPELYVSYDSAQKLKVEAGDLPSWDLTPRQICDLELLMNGGFHPLKGFLTEADYDGVVEEMRMADGTSGRCPITLDVSREVRRNRRTRPGHRAARPGRRDPCHHVGHRQVEPRQGARGRKGLRRERSGPPGRELPAQHGRPGLSGRADHRHPAARALRLQGPPRHAERVARLFPQARLASHRGLPDPQPAAPRPPGTDLPRRPRSAGQPADPPGRRHDQARRCRPLHPRALLRGGARQVSRRNDDDVPC